MGNKAVVEINYCWYCTKYSKYSREYGVGHQMCKEKNKSLQGNNGKIPDWCPYLKKGGE